MPLIITRNSAQVNGYTDPLTGLAQKIYKELAQPFHFFTRFTMTGDAATAFLAFGGIWFWGFVGILLAIELICVAKENSIAATFFLIAGTATLLYLGNGNPLFDWLSASWWNAGISVAAYLPIGIVYSIWRWYAYVGKHNDRVVELFLRQRKETHKDVLNDPEKTAKLVGYLETERPRASEAKQKISTWIVYWPISLLWYLLSDVILDVLDWTARQLKALGEWIYSKLFGIYRAVFKRRTQKTLDDLARKANDD